VKENLSISVLCNAFEDLAAKIKKKEAQDNELSREDLLSIDEIIKLASFAINDRDPAGLVFGVPISGVC